MNRNKKETLDQWKFLLWSDESILEILVLNAVSLRDTEVKGWHLHVWFPPNPNLCFCFTVFQKVITLT